MEGFNFLLEAFILLMGLAMAEVLGGFARVLKLRARKRAGIEDAGSIRIGWLTPLLGLFVILDQSTFFIHMFSMRETMPLNSGTVLGILTTIGWYYLIAAMTFPDHPASWPDFDDWFWQQKRFVVGGVIGVNVLSTAGQLIFFSRAEADKFMACIDPVVGGAAALMGFAAFPLMIWLFFSKSARVCQFLIIANVVILVVYSIMTFTTLEAVPIEGGAGFQCVAPLGSQ
jgi:hypothetical protein